MQIINICHPAACGVVYCRWTADSPAGFPIHAFLKQAAA